MPFTKDCRVMQTINIEAKQSTIRKMAYNLMKLLSQWDDIASERPDHVIHVRKTKWPRR